MILYKEASIVLMIEGMAYCRSSLPTGFSPNGFEALIGGIRYLQTKKDDFFLHFHYKIYQNNVNNGHFEGICI